MKYCILDDQNIVVNLIVCDTEEDAKVFGAVPAYDGAEIGKPYAPPAPPPPGPTVEERLVELETAVCEADIQNAQRMSEIETALCELDMGSGKETM